MTVGEYAGVPLQDAGDTFRNGAVFLLRKPPIRSASVSLDGWVTDVVQGAKFVVTRGSSTATDFEGTFAEALTAANRALDYMSVRAEADCAIRDAPDECLVWWPDTELDGVVMRCKVVQTHGLIMEAEGTVTYPDGTVPPRPPPPPAMAHDVFRFVRMSRTSDDLYDSYRNMFLALEHLLHELRPQQQREGEGAWFKDALAVADQLVPLSTLVPSGTTDAVAWTYTNMYGDERSGLSHAKRDYLLPQDDASREPLTKSLGMLSTYVAELIKRHFGVNRRNQSWSSAAVEAMAAGVLNRFAMVISDDGAPINPAVDGNPLAPDAARVELVAETPVADPSDPTLWTLVAGRDVADLAELTAIRRFCLNDREGDGTTWVFSEFLGALCLGGSVKRLEMMHGFRHINRTDAPRVFSS